MSARTQSAPAAPAAPAAKPSAPDAVLRKLLAANAAFVAGEPVPAAAASPALRTHLADKGQAPHTVVITCADSRVSPEYIFRAALGELFVIRNAGNVTWEQSVSASVEFAVHALRASVVIVLGHSKCGAVAAATAVARGSDMGDSSLARHIGRISTGVRHVCNDERAAVEHNVRNAVRELAANPVVAAAAAADAVKLVGAVYDIASGQVAVLDE